MLPKRTVTRLLRSGSAVSMFGNALIAAASSGTKRDDIAGVANAGGAGADQHQIGAEGADAVEHFLPAAFAHRQHGDHGGDADDDAEQASAWCEKC